MAAGRVPNPLWDTAPRLHIDDLRTSPTVADAVTDFTGRPGAAGYATHATPAARMFTDHLPRRSLLADAPPPSSLSTDPDADAEAAAMAMGRHTLDPFAAQSPSMRHLQHFRPVASPQAAMRPSDRAWRHEGPNGLPVDDARPRGLSTATSSRIHSGRGAADDADGYSVHRVRLQDAWHTDMWLYMKNAHPIIGVFAAHPRHPYKRRDRALVLLVALLVLFLLCGAFATQDCCESSLEVPVAVVSRRLEAAGGRQCAPFYSECDEVARMCTDGSVCTRAADTTKRTCVPVAGSAYNTSCAAESSSCPSGWSCDAQSLKCAPSTSLVCYVAPSASKSSTALRLAASDGDVASDSDGSKSDGITAIEAIFGILIIANGNDTSNSSTSGGDANGSSSQPPAAVSPSKNATATLQSLSMVLVEPTDGGVYSVQTKIPIQWEIRATDGGVQPLESFSVAFSADDKPFATIATDVRASDSGDPAASVFRFDWNLAGNSSLLCTKCVLRVCAYVDGGSQVCIRSDGGNATSGANSSNSSSSSRVSTAAASAKRGITFRIVREIISCSCGLAHAPFVEVSYLVALCLPLTALLLQQLVTFYEDSKLGGLCVNNRSRELSASFAPSPPPPSRLQVCSYSARGATRAGRVVVVVVLAVACVGCGYFVAQMTETKFFDQTGGVALLWLGMYGLSLLVGFVYCSALWLAIFSLRWKREATCKHPQQQRRQQQQQQQQDEPPLDSERVVELSDFVLTRHQEQQRAPSGVGGIV